MKKIFHSTCDIFKVFVAITSECGKDAGANELASTKETKMILEILLSIIITFGAQGPTNDFGECPATSEPETVAAQQA